jgi:MFS family permease
MVSRPFVMITVAALSMFVYIGVLTPLLPRLIEEQLGGNEIDIGLNLAVFSICAVLIRPALGRFAEVRGLRMTMITGAVIASAATVVCTFVSTRWALLPLRGLQGIGEASMFVGAATMINEMAPPGRTAEAASYFSVAVFGGLGIGPVISEYVVGHDRFDAGLFVAAAFAALASVLATFAPAGMRHESQHSEPGPRFHPGAIAPGLVLALGVGGFITFSAFMPEFSLTAGLSGSKWVFATYAAVCLLIRIVAATVPDRIGHARAVTVALTFLMAGLAALYLFPWPIGVFASTVVLGVGVSFHYPALMAMVTDVVPDRERVRAIATFTMFFEIGSAVGALTLGALADVTSKRSAFLGGAAFCALGLVVLWRVAVPRARVHVTV